MLGGLGAGAGAGGVVEVVLVELEVEELVLCEPDELVGGGQDSDVLATGPGRFSEEIGAP